MGSDGFDLEATLARMEAKLDGLGQKLTLAERGTTPARWITMATAEDEVVRHYGQGSLEQAIRDGLEAMGLGPEGVRPEDLAAVDEFHMGGHQATLELADALGLRAGMALLDLGSGLGGPARVFAGRHGCTVTGIDLTPEYVRVAEALTRLVGLAERVSFRTGSATDLPFEPARFDAATLLHVGMNIEDKAALCRAAARVLKPGGVFAVYDVMRTGAGELRFPLPWAAGPTTSFLAPPAAYREALAAADFTIESERDRSALALEVFGRIRRRIAETGPPPLGLHLVMGPDASQKIANVVAGLEQGVVAPIELICRRGRQAFPTGAAR